MAEPRCDPFPLIDLAGGPRERGKAYGEAAGARIWKSVELYRARLAKGGLAEDRVTALVERFVPIIAGFGADYLEEMRGIAEGSGRSFEDIVLVNARTEIVALADLDRRRGGEAAQDGCTGVVVMPDRSASGALIHAQNWDWLAACAETAVVLRIRNAEGPDILTFTEAGGLARSGLNSAGIAITANYLESDRDYSQVGVPLALIRRKALEQQHLAAAIRVVATTPKACSNNMILSHAQGFAVDFECAPDEAFPLYPQDGLLVHANHWVSPVALAKLREAGLAHSPDSLYRDWRVRQALAQSGRPLGPDDVKVALADRFGAPFAVCREPSSLAGEDLSATVATIVMDVAGGTMEVAPMPALGAVFARYRLRGETAQDSKAARMAASA